MIAYDSNEDSLHTGIVWFFWYAADAAHALGQLVSIDYSDSTPDVAFTYDRLGRQLTVTDVLGTRTNVYSPTDLLEERHPDGTALVRSYDAFGRPAGIALGTDYAVSYGYDEYGRFSTVAVSNGPTFTYSYVPDSSLLAGYTNTLGLAVAYAYEPHRDLKTLVSNAWSTNVISTFAYDYDAIGRRTKRVDSGLVTNVFGYNPRSELTSALMGTNSYTYAYDPIGNRTETVENGLLTTYAANSLNQYTALNASSPTPTPFTYDLDGNMTSDGIWSYSWDAENRLIEVQPLVTNLDSTLLQFMYDSQSRRIARREFSWNDYLGETTWHYVQGRAFLYDDWNLLEERKPAIVPRTPPTYISQTDLRLTGVTGPVAAAYVWGLDLSASIQGAGGVGGLLMQHHSDYTLSWFSFCDANANITDFCEAAGNIVARYNCDGFGNLDVPPVCITNSVVFCSSSKCYDGQSMMNYFGYRYYCPRFGRWMSRDPLGHLDGPSVYVFLFNNPIDRVDYLGLKCEDIVAEGFATWGERQLVEKMQSLHCSLPMVRCACCSSFKAGGFKPQNNSITICSNSKTLDAEYRTIRRHELRHAFDCCVGKQGNCYDFGGMKQMLCGEIRAYCWSNGSGLFPSNQERIIDNAISSLLYNCDLGYSRIWSSRFRPIARKIFGSCCNAYGNVVDQLPSFPPEPWPNFWAEPLPKPPKIVQPSVCK